STGTPNIERPFDPESIIRHNPRTLFDTRGCKRFSIGGHTMPRTMSRRSFVQLAGTAMAGAAVLQGAPQAAAGEFTGKINKAVKYAMISGDASPAEKLAMLKEIGYDGVEIGVRDKVDRDAV